MLKGQKEVEGNMGPFVEKCIQGQRLHDKPQVDVVEVELSHGSTKGHTGVFSRKILSVACHGNVPKGLWFRTGNCRLSQSFGGFALREPTG